MRLVWSWAGQEAGRRGRTLQRWGSERRAGEVWVRGEGMENRMGLRAILKS